MSSYQADWYVDEDGEGDFDEGDREDDGEEHGDGDGDGNEGVGMKDLNEDDRSIKGPGAIEMGDEIDDDDQSMMDGSIANTVTFGGNLDNKQSASAALTEKNRLRTLAQAKDDKEFPDELDTPADVSARSRFARYRALQSFRSSPWHPKENLPVDYARIFQFENFGSAQRR